MNSEQWKRIDEIECGQNAQLHWAQLAVSVLCLVVGVGFVALFPPLGLALLFLGVGIALACE